MKRRWWAIVGSAALVLVISYSGYVATHRDPLAPLYSLHPTAYNDDDVVTDPFSGAKISIRRFVFSGSQIQASRSAIEASLKERGWKLACAGDTFEIFTSPNNPGNEQIGWFLIDDGKIYAKVIDRAPASKSKGLLKLALNRLSIPSSKTPSAPSIPSGSYKIVTTLSGTSTLYAPRKSTIDLVQAINDNNIDDAKKAVAAGAQINDASSDDIHWSPVGVAIGNQNLNIAQYLLEHGADPNLSIAGVNLICAAAGDGNLGAIRLLISQGARLNPEDPLPLILCCDQRTPNESLWHLAEGFEIGDGQAWQDSVEVARFLLSKRLPVNGRASASKQTALHKAATCGHMQLVRLLLAQGADPNLKDKDGHTALDLALANKDNEWRLVAEALSARMKSSNTPSATTKI